MVGVFTLSGGFIFGRSQYEASNRATLTVRLVPRSARDFSSDDWVRRNKQLASAIATAARSSNTRQSPSRPVVMRRASLTGISYSAA